jgi:hypothetical protein
MDAPNINVSAESGTITVSGFGFIPGSTVHIRVADDQATTLFFDQSADGDGSLNAQLTIPCIAGLLLHFSANDGRSNAEDVTGTLWSNTFHIPCPGSGGGSGGGFDDVGDG